MNDSIDKSPSEKPADPFLKRVRLRNYKSIGHCDVELGPLTLLVGRNGSGKSNFLDAMRFVTDSLESSLDHALKFRGGIEEVRRRSTGHPTNFAIQLEMNLPDWSTAEYGFEIAARKQRGFFVKNEMLRIYTAARTLSAKYRIRRSTDDDNTVESNHEPMPPAVSDRLYIVTAAGLPDFRGVYQALRSMGFYSLNAQSMKELQSPDAGELLHRDGGNIASVVARLAADSNPILNRIKSYLEHIILDITDVKRIALGLRETLEFRQKVIGSEHPWRFYAGSMSDGTMRALGILVAVMQLAERQTPVRLVGIEEPETALHPAAAGALMDALREATVHTQVVVTTHSPDLLDHFDPEHDKLLTVQSNKGNTQIGQADAASIKAIQDHLYTPGELLRMDQLEPDQRDIDRQEQLLFDFDDEADE